MNDLAPSAVSARLLDGGDDARLRVTGLSVGYRKPDGSVEQVVRDVSYALRGGEILGLVGETGCGKSTTALASIGYRGRGAVIMEGRAFLGGRDLLTLNPDQLRAVWGREIAYISQNAATSLNPALTIGTQLDQPLRRHLRLTGARLTNRKLELLQAVGIDYPGRALRRYPHQFSGGQQQRVSLAIALSCRPSVLILDEPTTGLDVTTQARISALLQTLVAQTGVSVVYVSHDLALLSTLATRVCVMYAGEIVEEASTVEVVTRPLHPYTRALLAAVPSARVTRVVTGISGEPPLGVVADRCPFAPRCALAAEQCLTRHPALVLAAPERSVRCVRLDAVKALHEAPRASLLARDRASRSPSPLLRVDGLSCFYHARGHTVAAVRDVSFQVLEGETLGVVGLSGSGKSTMLRALVGLHARTQGEITFRDQRLTPKASRRPRSVRRDMQIVFQDPGSSLNPRHTVGQIVARPIRLFRDDLTARDRESALVQLLESVKLSRSLLWRYPWELSGGQQQRVAIARAFATNPALLLCDEVTSSLDVSVQATILQLIGDLAREHETAVIFVSHDLAVIRTVADRAIVMLDGEIVEAADTERLFSAPTHPYTAELLSAVPDASSWPLHDAADRLV